MPGKTTRRRKPDLGDDYRDREGYDREGGDEAVEVHECLDEIPKDLNVFEAIEYKPSPQAALFHESTALWRYLVWGVRSGKTYAGAPELVSLIVEKAKNYPYKGRRPLGWVVAPTLRHTATCEVELDAIFATLEEAGYPILKQKRLRDHTYILCDNSKIECRTGDIPDNLRGPNVDAAWCDEIGYLKEAAWFQVKQRLSTRRGEIIATTSPNGRNFLWGECCQAGMPKTGDYGVFSDGKGLRWMSHYKTEDFAWVDREFLEDARATMPRDEFEKDFEAKFLAAGKNVFRYIEESMDASPIIQNENAKYVMGLDLAKQKDFTAWFIMDGTGRVYDGDRWTGIDWQVQIARIEQISAKWKASIVMDVANVGNAICDALRAKGLQVHPVDMHSPRVKIDLIQSLQSAFDTKGASIKIPDPKTEWCPAVMKVLIDELRSYEASLTPGGNLSYGAPKNHHDDTVIALALCWMGKQRGLAGGGLTAADVAIGRDNYEEQSAMERQEMAELMKMKRPAIFGKIFGRSTKTGFPGGKPVFH